MLQGRTTIHVQYFDTGPATGMATQPASIRHLSSGEDDHSPDEAYSHKPGVWLAGSS